MADKCVGMFQVPINSEGENGLYALDNLRHTLDFMAIGDGKQFHTRRFHQSAAGGCFDSSDISVANRQASCYIVRGRLALPSLLWYCSHLESLTTL